jgi:integrase
MSGAKVSDFMLQFMKRFIDEKNVAESTANHYINTLYTLNDKTPFKTLAFLRNTEAIKEKVENYAPSTQKTLYAVIVSALDFYKTKAPYKKAHDFFSALLKDKREEIEGNAGKMSDKQETNWVDWNEVLKKKSEMKTAISSFVSNKSLTAKQYDDLLAYLILSLYTDIQPRRNQDYMDMYVVLNEPADTTKNYYVVSDHKFVFNKYKTSKKWGKQVINVPNNPDAPLVDTLAMFLKHHPLNKGKMSKKTEFRLLVKQDGSPLNSVNSITRILNRIFGKKVGSSMLRHIFLTGKYGDEKNEMVEDAKAMGHSVAQQKDYILAKE